MAESGTLYLVPVTLGGPIAGAIPEAVIGRIRALDHFIAENPKTLRAMLKRIGVSRALAELSIERFDHNTPAAAIAALLAPLARGTDVGLASEAGCPALADPGSALVLEAHRRGIRVVPLPGPSSIVLALIASGLESQRFAFHGYLPVKSDARDRRIAEIEARSRDGETQLFIETPYRNDRMLQALLRACHPDTLLCVASELTRPGESVRTLPVARWRSQPPSLDGVPVVFLLLAPPRPRR